MSEVMGKTAGHAHSIVGVSVDDLFGRYSYELPEAGKGQDLSNLFILYGDNGSGKTTILRVLFPSACVGGQEGAQIQGIRDPVPAILGKACGRHHG